MPVPGGHRVPQTPTDGGAAPGAPGGSMVPQTPPWRLSGFLADPPGLQQYALVSMFSFCFFCFSIFVFFEVIDFKKILATVRRLHSADEAGGVS